LSLTVAGNKPIDRAHTSFYLRFLVTMSLSGTVSEISRDIGRKSPFEPLFDGTLGVIPLEFRLDFWHRKTRVTGLSEGVVCVILGLTIFVELRFVTDGRTERRTDN